MTDAVETMFYRGEIPWHRSGNPIPEDQQLDIQGGLTASGTDWEVGTIPLMASIDPVDYEGLPPDSYDALQGQRVSHRLTYRKSDNAVLGVVGPRYEVVQNRDAFQFFQPFLDAGECILETAGSLNGGRVVWVLARITRDPIVVKGNDTVDKYALITNSHDGSMSLRAGYTPIRTVCRNTLDMALRKGVSRLLRFRHTASVLVALDKVHEIMNMADRSFEATAEQYRFLANSPVSQKDLKRYVTEVMDYNPKKDGSFSTRTQNTLDKIFSHFEYGRGSDVSPIRGTFWNAYNAVTEFLTYDRGKDEGSRLHSLWYGDSMLKNQRALRLAVDMADAS